MNKQFIEQVKQTATYKLKEGTASSYYWQSGTRLLPNRLSLSTGRELSKTARKGRALTHTMTGQIIGTFTKKEESPLKRFKPYTVRSSIWQIDEYPLLFGYGTLGTSNSQGRVTRETDKGDLILLQFVSENELKISYYPKAAKQLYNILESEY